MEHQVKTKWTGKYLRKFRVSIGLTQLPIMRYLGYKHTNRIQEFETGERILPEAQSRLMDILEASVTQQPIDIKIDDNVLIHVTATRIYS